MDFVEGFFAAAAGAMGLGGGGILLAYLAAAGVPQLTAQGINLMFFIPTAAVALGFHLKNGYVRWRTALTAGLAGLAGAPIGFWLAGAVGDRALRLLFAAGILALGVRELFARPEPEPEQEFDPRDKS